MSNKSVIFKRRLRFSLIILVSQMLLVALAIGWGVNLILIAQHGGIYSVEANPWVLYGEIAATVLIIIFAFIVIYLEIIRIRSKRRSDRDSQDQIQNEKRTERQDEKDGIESIEDLMKS
jgi:uncharacterized membrane protein YcjF (UPF0283 family)